MFRRLSLPSTFLLLILASCGQHQEYDLSSVKEAPGESRAPTDNTERYSIIPAESRLVLSITGEEIGRFRNVRGDIVASSDRITGSGTLIRSRGLRLVSTDDAADSGELLFSLDRIVNKEGRLMAQGVFHWGDDLIRSQGIVDRVRVTPEEAILFMRFQMQSERLSQLPGNGNNYDQPIDFIIRLAARRHMREAGEGLQPQ